MVLDVNLQHLVDAIDLDLSSHDPLAKVHEAQLRARSLTDIGDQLVDHFVAQARAAGAPWSLIGEALGVSKQAAQQRWVSPLFQSLTYRVRQVIVLAQERARAFRHDRIGPEHLLLGVLDEGEGVAVQILTQVVGAPEPVRQAVIAAIVPGTDAPAAKMPFTDAGSAVLAQANAEATGLGHAYVGTEHLLLGLLAAGSGTAATVLDGLGVRYDETRTKVIEWTAAFLARQRPG
jgi:ClpA/ClpB-like protein